MPRLEHGELIAYDESRPLFRAKGTLFLPVRLGPSGGLVHLTVFVSRLTRQVNSG
jgi:hypothetical protein